MIAMTIAFAMWVPLFAYGMTLPPDKLGAYPDSYLPRVRAGIIFPLP